MTQLTQRLLIFTLVTLLGTGTACSDDDHDNGLCGNGFLDDGEVCDTINLAGQTCEDVGNYTGGTLACATDCGGFDTAGCTVPVTCGNGQIDIDEDCDDTHLDNTLCQDLAGFTGGTLACANDCSFDTTSCVVGIGPGSIVITEIMANPAGVNDANGEWFEVHNSTSVSIDLNGWFLASSDDGTHLIDAGGPLVIPVLGQINFDPGTAWSVAGVSTLNDTMRRMCNVGVGDTNGGDVFDPSVEWTSAGNDVFTDLGQHCP